jgi:hypothetical protein
MHPSPDQSWSLPEHPGLYADEAGTSVTNAAGFSIGWRGDGEPFVVEGYGIALWGKNPGEPPQGQDEVLRVLKQLGCTILEDTCHVAEGDDPEIRGRQCRALEIQLPVNMTEKQGQRFRNALDRWDREFEANIDTGDIG